MSSTLFQHLTSLIQEFSSDFDQLDYIPHSKAKIKKECYLLYGKKSVSLMGRKAQPICFVGIIQQTHYVGLYFMPIYSHPKDFVLSPELRKIMKGKGCFHVKKLSEGLEKEIREMIQKGYEIYKENEWI